MISLNSINMSLNSFSFDLTLSSGDELTMSIYDNQKSELHFDKEKNSKNFTMSLTHELGYKISYKGDGIDKQDQKEIEKAMKKIKPIFDKFIKNIKKYSAVPDDNEMIKWVDMAKKELPNFKDQNSVQKLKEQTAKSLDDVLAIFERDSKIIESAKKFFDKLFDASKRFSYYA